VENKISSSENWKGKEKSSNMKRDKGIMHGVSKTYGMPIKVLILQINFAKNYSIVEVI
jgi:hypothetical protein